jgi:uncharacterized protein
MKSLLLLILRIYKYAISPLMGQNCRFYPSCSDYAAQAIQTHGVCKGSLLAGKRLCKCHPWHPGGVDLVPEVASSDAENSSENTLKKTQTAPTSAVGNSSTLN